MLLSNSKAADRQYGPESGLADSEIMTVLVLYHSSRFKNFKTFYNGIVLGLLRACFPGAPCYERFIALTSRVWTLLVFFLASRMGRKTDIYYIDSTPLPVCHNRRIAKHKVFTGGCARSHACARVPLRQFSVLRGGQIPPGLKRIGSKRSRQLCSVLPLPEQQVVNFAVTRAEPIWIVGDGWSENREAVC